MVYVSFVYLLQMLVGSEVINQQVVDDSSNDVLVIVDDFYYFLGLWNLWLKKF